MAQLVANFGKYRPTSHSIIQLNKSSTLQLNKESIFQFNKVRQCFNDTDDDDGNDYEFCCQDKENILAANSGLLAPTSVTSLGGQWY